MTKILLSLGGSGIVLTSLYWLEAKGEVSINHKAIKVCVGGVLVILGVMFAKQLGAFI